jgi:DNA helicase-2/ATP-dependent DNA helicase PcrA
MLTPLACGVPVEDEQHRIIDHLCSQPVTVVAAGAGAGKTYTTVTAVLEAIARRLASADEFVLITFTNKAADELRGRLQMAFAKQIGRVPTEAERDFWRKQRERMASAHIGTIHSFCSSLLEQHGYPIGIAHEASVSKAQRRLVEAVAESVLEVATRPGELRSPLAVPNGWRVHELKGRLKRMIEETRSQGMDGAQLRTATEGQTDDAGKPFRVFMAQLVEDAERRFEERCRLDQQIDPSASILLTASMLGRDSDGRLVKAIGRRYRYLFVDEFQDTSQTQIEIIQRLSAQLIIMAVGDRKQSIYAFSGADVTLIDEFARNCNTSPLPLTETGRPTTALLEAQNALFRSMRTRFPALDEPLSAAPWAPRPTGALPHMVVLQSPPTVPSRFAQFATRIANVVGLDSGAGFQITPGDIVVLTRENAEVDPWVEALRAAGLDAQADKGTPFFQRDEIVAIYRLLNLVVRYPDDPALVEALRTEYFDSVDLVAEEARLLTYGFQRGTPLTGAFEREYPNEHRRILDLRTASRSMTVPELLGKVEVEFAMKARYQSAGDDDRAIALDRLRDYARSCFDNDEALTLRTFLSILRREIENNEKLPEPESSQTQSPPYARVMTIHQAKGLEFPVVVIPHAEKDRKRGTLPPRWLIDPNHGLDIDVTGALAGGTWSTAFRRVNARAQERKLEEEMRLLYVAVTRAKNLVIFLCSNKVSPASMTSSRYTWEDEILHARTALRLAGTKFVPA